jgi:hypothetical protein
MKKRLLLIFPLLLIVSMFYSVSFAQKKGTKPEPALPQATSATDRLKGFEKRKELIKNSLVANIPFRSIGPTIMSGRVVDIDVNPQDPSVFLVAYASGGLWKG